MVVSSINLSASLIGNLLELLSIVSKVQKFSSKVYAVIPYMGYARQDREFLGGEIITT